MRRIGKSGLSLVKGFETFVPYVYDDKVPMQKIGGRRFYREWRGEPVIGTLTIGYGHTDAAAHQLKIELGLRITEAQALEILDVDLDECEMAVNRMVKVEITQGMFDALVSFCFNCGTGALKMLVARLNLGDYDGTRAAFDRYIYSKGTKMLGLQRRRDAEQLLWDDEAALPEWETQVAVEHPAEVDPDPVPVPPTSMAQSSEGNAAVAAGTAGTTTTAILLSNAVKGASAAKTLSLWGFLIALAEQPEFWAAVVGAVLMIGAPAYLWFKRASDLKLKVR